MTVSRWLSIQLEHEEDAQGIRREARALGMSLSAYTRLLIQIGRDKLFTRHLVSELKDFQSPEMREAIFLLLAGVAETRALTRASARKTIGEEAVRREQDQVAPGIQSLRHKLRVADRAEP